MKMDKSAIQQIQETALAAQEVRGTDFPVKAMAGSMALQSLEPYQEFRNRFSGTFNTRSLENFVAYVEDKGGENCFISVEDMTAKTIFNLGDEDKAGHADNVAVLALSKTAPYSELLSHNGSSETQRSLAEWIEDWRDFIRVIDEDGKDMTTQEASAAIRRITIEAVRKQGNESRTFGESKSSLESIDAKSDSGAMPAWIEFTCKPYEDIKEHSFHSRISITTGRDTPSLISRIIKLEAIKEEIAKEFKEKLSDNLGKNISIYLGRFSTK